MPRGLSNEFLAAMRKKLDHGRHRGYVGWDTHWECSFKESPRGPLGFLMLRLREEVAELTLAVHSNRYDDIREEAADVANLAMMVADVHGSLQK